MASRLDAARYALAFSLTFVPIYATERLADYYFLTDNTASFYFMSGWRLILFIAFTLGGSVAAGAILRRIWGAAATQWGALVVALALFFYLCDPRVCFSAGPDGLEPLRLGFFLGSVSFSGASLGVAARRAPSSPFARLLAGVFGFAAVGFYPVVFTFAGTRLLQPFHPWASAAILAMAAFPISAAASLDLGGRRGVLVPIGAMALLLLLSAGIALGYLQSVLFDVGVLAAGVAAAAIAGGVLAAKRRDLVARHRGKFSSLLAFGTAFVLLMMLFATPDAVNGVVPVAGSASSFAQGVPVYAGAAMAGPAGHTDGAGVTVSFAGTDAASIQADNYLAAGMGIHAAGCCVDGIDYSYRYDLYLFNSGNESMVASAWEVCDDNAACGGHSWKVLMFLQALSLGRANLSADVTLTVSWVQGTEGTQVVWSYSTDGGGSREFTSFTPSPAENHDFNTGILAGGTTSGQNASYFFQFGVMSRYPIGEQGWNVLLSCPSVFNGTWSCVDHAITLDGSQSYWKIFWRWGEDYPGVSVTSPERAEVLFAYSRATTPSFRQLW